MKWVVIPPGLRKEEIAALLAPALGWTTKQKTEWIKKSTTTKPEYIEGVYAPDTYLIRWEKNRQMLRLGSLQNLTRASLLICPIHGKEHKVDQRSHACLYSSA